MHLDLQKCLPLISLSLSSSYRFWLWVSHFGQLVVWEFIDNSCLGLITYINLVSVKLYVKINNIFGVCKVIACLIVIFGGVYELAMGNTQNLKSGFQGTNYNFGYIALAFYNGLWSYDGWSSVTTITEEIKEPEKWVKENSVRHATMINPKILSRNIPRSISIAVPIVTLLYVFMNVAYLTVLSKEEMINSVAVGMSFGERVLGPFSFVIPLGVALSCFGCALSIQFGCTRLCYVSARGKFEFLWNSTFRLISESFLENHMPEPLSYIHVTRSTPAPAVFLQGFLALLFLLVGDISALIEFASFLIWFFYGAAMVALLVMRKTHAKVHRPYKVPIVLPIFTLLVAVFLVVTPIINEPDIKYLSALGFILSGFAVYVPFVYMKKRPRIMNKLTHLIQLFFMAAPTSIEEKDL